MYKPFTNNYGELSILTPLQANQPAVNASPVILVNVHG